MKNIIVVAVATVLTACSPTLEDKTSSFTLPPDLPHCRVLELEKGGPTSGKLFLIKCPEGYLGTHALYPVGKTNETSSTYIY